MPREKPSTRWCPAFLVSLLILGGCGRKEAAPTVAAPAAAKSASALTLTSSSFAAGQPIPAQFTCDGKNTSPALRWSGVPKGAKSLALICDDPDAPAGTWTHWILFDLPPTVTGLPEGVAKQKRTAEGGTQGINDFMRIGYDGPCPPGGRAHHYFFRLYALDAKLGLGPQTTRREFDRAMKRHILGEGQLMGTYQRQ